MGGLIGTLDGVFSIFDRLSHPIQLVNPVLMAGPFRRLFFHNYVDANRSLVTSVIGNRLSQLTITRVTFDVQLLRSPIESTLPSQAPPVPVRWSVLLGSIDRDPASRPDG